jgi:hypothetical protein
MLRRTALKPRRKYKPVELDRFHDWIADHGCLVCEGLATVHHVRGYADRPGSITKSHWLVVPLCPGHHLIQHGPRWSVEALGHQGFFRIHGIDLYQEAVRLAETWQRRMVA